MKSFLSFLLLFGLVNHFFGQEFYIDESPRTHKGGTYYSFMFELPDVSKTEADEEWKKFINAYKGKSKYDKKNKTWFTDNAKMPKLSTTSVDVYAKIIEDSNPNRKTSVIVWFDLGGAYINAVSHPNEAVFAREILTEYAMTTSRHHADGIVKAQEKELAEMEDQLKTLVKDNAAYRKEIEKAHTLIAKRTKEIEINDLDQRDMEKAIQEQKEKLIESRKTVKRLR